MAPQGSVEVARLGLPAQRVQATVWSSAGCGGASLCLVREQGLCAALSRVCG